MSYLPPAAIRGGRANRQRAIRASVGTTADAQQDLNAMISNILDIWHEANEHEVCDGSDWYRYAYGVAGALSGFSVAASTRPDSSVPELTTNQVVGIMAVLSPSTDWDRNIKLAHHMVMTGNCSHAYGECITKARLIRDGADPGTVLGGRKVKNFYSAIVNRGTTAHVVVDRHAHAIALGMRAPLGDWAAKALDAPGRYQIVAAAYRGAARQAGVTPCHMQATTWLCFRRQYGGRGGRGYGVTAAQAEEF